MYKDVIFDFSEEKNQLQKLRWGFGFNYVIQQIKFGNLIDVIEHHNKKKYKHQKMFIVLINDYIYVVPYVQSRHVVFLKTFFKSRNYMKKFGVNKKDGK